MAVALLVVVLVTLLSAAGCQNPFGRSQAETETNELFASLPPRLDAAPDVAQICRVVNENAQRIGSLRSTDAALDVSQLRLMSLRTEFFYQRPGRLRLTGSAMALAGQAFDLGSNDELFWFWVTGDPTYYCRHADYPAVARTGELPIDPKLIFEGLGVEILGDDEEVVAGPEVVSGLLALRTVRPETRDRFSKWIYIDPRQGVPVYHVVLTPEGQTLATVAASNFLHDAASGALVPRRLDLVMRPGTRNACTVTLKMPTLAVNQPITSGTAWAMPNYNQTVQPIDLGARAQAAGAVASRTPMGLSVGTVGLMASSPNATPITSPALASGVVAGTPSMSVAPNSYETARPTGDVAATGETPPGMVAGAAAGGGNLPDFDLNDSPDYSVLPPEVASEAAAGTLPPGIASPGASSPGAVSPAVPAGMATQPPTDPFAAPGAARATAAITPSGNTVTPSGNGVLLLPPPPVHGAGGGSADGWVAGESGWESGSGDPLAGARRIIVPNRPPATPLPLVGQNPGAAAPSAGVAPPPVTPEPATVTLPAGVRPFWSP